MRLLLLILIINAPWLLNASEIICNNNEELKKAIAKAVPGDTITMANGNWRDLKLEFYAQGEPGKTIVLRSEEFGKVFLEGESYLELRGDYLVVDGLIFQNGYSPKSAVISFKKSSQQVANNCRVTNCAIDQYSRVDRYERDYWVSFYGKNNRLDHCYLAGKLNYGSTVTVWLGNEESVQNYHQIDHNFFGHRPRLGSNGGETIRIGSSKNSMASSYTQIKNNYFKHCNGETEIISIKSCDNSVENNTFFECEGSLVLRHGNRNLVSGNIFLGNGLPYTGGIRVIGEDHKIFNNYFQGLKGKEFRAPMVLMNGIPNSPINRYFQVKNVQIAFNSWIDCDEPWLFGMGIKDEPSTIPPEGVLVAYNLVYNSSDSKAITALDDIAGIQFLENIFSGASCDSSYSGIKLEKLTLDTLENNLLTLKCINPLDVKESLKKITAPAKLKDGATQCHGIQFTNYSDISRLIANAKNTGPENYKPLVIHNYTPYLVKVEPGDGTLEAAINEAKPGAVLELSKGEYIMNKRLKIFHPIIVRCESSLEKPVLKHRSTEPTKIFFEIQYGGNLKLENLVLDGEASSANPTKYAVTSAKEKMALSFGFEARNCTFQSFTSVEQGGAIFKAYKGSFADSIIFSNCSFLDVYRGIDLDEETDDKGIYNAEYVQLNNTLFKNLDQYAISFYRGGKDESTFGPHLTVDHCVFDNVNNRAGASILQLVGVQRTTITNSIFCNSPEAKYVVELYGKYNTISFCNVHATGQIGVENGARIGPGMMYYKPMFEEDSYNLKAFSFLIGNGLEGKNIGLLKEN